MGDQPLWQKAFAGLADQAKPVTAVEACAISARSVPGRFTIGDGTHLRLRGPTSAVGASLPRRDGKRGDMGLGGYPKVSLAEARVAVVAARAGTKDPLAERRARATQKAADRTAPACTIKAAAAAS